MDVATYRRKRQELEESRPVLRQICGRCLQPGFSCFCPMLKPIVAELDFVILTHPIEVRRRIATGRMAHLSLEGSALIQGVNYTDNEQLNEILADPRRFPVLLYPGRHSVNLTGLSREERRALVPLDKRLTAVVIDGTWGTARTMVNCSLNLQRLPRVCFTPTTPSNFRVRKQPRPECYSTIEAIHHTIGLFSEGNAHDQLLYVFDRMVDRQLELAHSSDAIAREFR